MSEWLLSEHQSICVRRDRMSAPMPCVLPTQRYGFFIRSNQWYMKQHIHISNNRSFLVLRHANPWCELWQQLGFAESNDPFLFFFGGGAFSFAVWVEVKFNIDGKQAINSMPRLARINDGTSHWLLWTQHLCQAGLSQEHCVDAFVPGLFALFLCPARQKKPQTAHILRLAWWGEHAVPCVLYFTQPTAHPRQSADLLTCLSLWWPLLSGGSYFMKMVVFSSALLLKIITRQMTRVGAGERKQHGAWNKGFGFYWLRVFKICHAYTFHDVTLKLSGIIF